MKRVISFIVLVVCLFSLTSVAFAEDFSFRGTTFGMSMKQVAAAEGTPPVRVDDALLQYMIHHNDDYYADIIYMFENNLLYSIFVTLVKSNPHTDSNLYIDDFNGLDLDMKARFGEPFMDSVYSWSNDLFEGIPSCYGIALESGHLDIMSSWDFDECLIGHTLTSSDGELLHQLFFISTKH